MRPPRASDATQPRSIHVWAPRKQLQHPQCAPQILGDRQFAQQLHAQESDGAGVFLLIRAGILWKAGNNDGLMVKDRIEPALDRMRRAYGTLDAPGNLNVDFFDGRHERHGVKAHGLPAGILKP